jgi:hypothetical protein
MPEYVWLVYEDGGHLFGIFSSEEKQIEACKEFDEEGAPGYRVEKIRLDP